MKLNLWPFSRKATSLDVLRSLYSYQETRSGVNVTWETALEVSTVFACARVISDALSTVPFRLFQKSGRARAPADSEPLYSLFDVAPNEFQDTLQFRETMSYHVVLTGNAYAFINRVRGRVVEIMPIDPQRVSVEQNDDMSVVYSVSTPKGEIIKFPQETIWHWRGPSWCGYKGMSLTRTARDSIGLATVMQRSASRLHANGVRPTGTYTVDGVLTDTTYKQLRAYLKAEMSGVDNTGLPLIMDRSAKFTSMAMTGVDAQHIESRKNEVEELCRFFGVMPIMVGFSDKAATYASAEQMFLAHAVHTARPWQRRIEASAQRQLLTEAQRRAGMYFKFIDSELLRGAAATRAEYYRSGISSGWMTRNEAREWEELNPIAGLDEPLSPMNMVVGNPEPAQPATTNQPGG